MRATDVAAEARGRGLLARDELAVGRVLLDDGPELVPPERAQQVAGKTAVAGEQGVVERAALVDVDAPLPPGTVDLAHGLSLANAAAVELADALDRLEVDRLVDGAGRRREAGRERVVGDERRGVEGPLVRDGRGEHESSRDQTAIGDAQRACAAKRRSKARPSRWLFSGWNWTPKMSSRRTAAAKGPPWSVVAATSCSRRGRKANPCAK